MRDSVEGYANLELSACGSQQATDSSPCKLAAVTHLGTVGQDSA